jgi:hypothetical protein
MNNWLDRLKFDPLTPLLSSGSEALEYFTCRDLLEEQVGPIQRIWQLPEAQRILKKQLANGAWPRSGENKHPAINYQLIETWRQFRFLVEQYGFTRAHLQAEKAAEYTAARRREDIRG